MWSKETNIPIRTSRIALTNLLHASTFPSATLFITRISSDPISKACGWQQCISTEAISPFDPWHSNTFCCNNMGVTIDNKGRERWKRRGREGATRWEKDEDERLGLGTRAWGRVFAFDDGPSQQLGKINQ
jgi:hypothetical protein